jgi:hypothetical protein
MTFVVENHIISHFKLFFQHDMSFALMWISIWGCLYIVVLSYIAPSPGRLCSSVRAGSGDTNLSTEHYISYTNFVPPGPEYSALHGAELLVR